MMKKEPILLDGRTGEGGGQLVRLACALAAVTSQPIRIENVRGNRGGGKGGGLKAQHVTSIAWLAQATRAEVSGLEIGSRTLEFRPLTPPSFSPPGGEEEEEGRGGWTRKIKIAAESPAASTLLIFQAVFPYLLFASSSSAGGTKEKEKEEEDEDEITLEIHGGTNVSFSLSYEYLDQVLLPTLEQRFGIAVKRTLRRRAWAVGPKGGRGCFEIRFRPLRPGQCITPLLGEEAIIIAREQGRRGSSREITRVDASIIAPFALHAPLQTALARELGGDGGFPDAEVRFRVVEDGGHDARIYTLLVASCPSSASPPGEQVEEGGDGNGEEKQGRYRWGRDWLYDRKRKDKSPQKLAGEIATKVCRDLRAEVERGGVVDEFMQDQLVVFQALTKGRTWVHRGGGGGEGGGTEINDLGNELRGLGIGKEEVEGEGGEEGMRRDRETDRPFGEGSTHATTARWVASQLLPDVRWYNDGTVCDGAGVSIGFSVSS
ncbi:RNA 3'-terminal phosphate cyclase domain-containing protein [Xylariomycetidae sp. FL2044]|nr:RNA 3'-terminal phosphate cyclase domain-containing protein [Xylariomycetidae sp. FL2044]